ncbi:MAG: hypothetical protein IJ672_00935 [Methanobrevibacter sp.]|nr:hypothetical protein [Methanobrevibacter sp.]MBR1610045.1 hypothetical protein [Methanobrevibacter sp.]
MRRIDNFKKQPLFIKILDILSLIGIIYELIVLIMTGTLNYALMPGVTVVLCLSIIFRKTD